MVHDTAQHADALVADGPYRYARNPLYLAGLPMAAGIGVLANWIFLYRLIFREEEALRKSQGEPYLAYCRAVPRFWPSFWPRVPCGGLQPRWAQAFAGETFVWLFGVAELAIAATLSASIGYVLFFLGFVAHFVISRSIKEKRKAAASKP